MSKARTNQPSENLKRCWWFFSSVSGVGIMLISFAGKICKRVHATYAQGVGGSVVWLMDRVWREGGWQNDDYAP